MAVSKKKSVKAKATKAKATINPAVSEAKERLAKADSLYTEVARLTEQYVENIWKLYDEKEPGAGPIERIADMREKLMYRTCKLCCVNIGHNSEEFAEFAGMLRAMSAAWDGDDSRFKDAEESEYEALTDFLSYR